MKINIFKPEKKKRHIVNLTANVLTLGVTALIIMAFVSVGAWTIYKEIAELFTPKATYLVYHCKKKKKVERVPMIIDGTIKTEADLWSLVADIEAVNHCKVIIEPGWRVFTAKKPPKDKE